MRDEFLTMWEEKPAVRITCVLCLAWVLGSLVFLALLSWDPYIYTDGWPDERISLTARIVIAAVCAVPAMVVTLPITLWLVDSLPVKRRKRFR